MELEPELIPVHAIDNGIVRYIPDSGVAHVAKASAMSLAILPLGVLWGLAARTLRAECELCGKVFARSEFSRVLEKNLIRFVTSGELVIRSYTPPPIPEYRYGESHAIAIPKKKEESRLSQFAAAAVFAMLFWGCVVYGVSSRRFDAGNVFADLVCFVIAAVFTLAAIQSLRKPVETVPKIASRQPLGPPRMDRLLETV